MNRLVSIITATYNNVDFLSETINSVLNQSIQNWEWVIVNNGSTDDSAVVLAEIHDPRVRIIHLEKNVGVSEGRNIAIRNSFGEFICFLDGDDILTPNSIESRLKVFEKDDEIQFVDGKVISFKESFTHVVEEYFPRFSGNPLERLLSLDGSVFKGNTWMIKRILGKKYEFNSSVSHGEELLFYAQIAQTGKYDYCNDPILFYRRHEQSAMANLEALAEGYYNVGKELSNLSHVNRQLINAYKRKASSVVLKSFIAKGRFLKAIKGWTKLRGL